MWRSLAAARLRADCYPGRRRPHAPDLARTGIELDALAHLLRAFATPEEIIAKFRKLARATMGEAQQTALIDTVFHLAELLRVS